MNEQPPVHRVTLPPRHEQTANDPLSALQAGLEGPDAQAVRQETVERLTALEQRLRRSMTQGHPPGEFVALAAATDACVAARELVQRYSHAR